MTERRPRVMTYSHDGFGLGHLRRNMRLVNALLAQQPEAAVLMMTGSPVSNRFPFPANVDNIKLPSLGKVANDHYVSRRLGLDRDEVSSLRAALLAAAVEEFRPDLLLVDFYPLGVHRELVGALHTAKRLSPSPRLFLGWRDILDDPAQVQREWGDTGQLDGIDEFFDQILIYGCQHIYDPLAEYDLQRLAPRTSFTGYLVDRTPTATRSPVKRPRAVCTLGGGEDGASVAWAFLDAMDRLGPSGWTGVLVTGPLMDGAEITALGQAARRARVTCVPFVEDMASMLAGADVVVAMAGYNTLCEVLAAETPAVLIPRTSPRAEQLMRATRLADCGLVSTLVPPEVNGGRLAELVVAAARVARSEIRARLRASLDLDGLRRAGAALASGAVQSGFGISVTV